ncbi:unnamed protein product [Penicillium salamii]|uniref:Carrier domain-containing protein n=1 Tax=Penicillium salamii TaxID=1612424 RepID=A0A9W4NKA4_9EURO|nr:unnamed protein product [Penicillium salamii]CAG8068246.1 unnamed protein product [Penicillium salamii]CAG8075745.1 unnamed protein product [Penicillium salamii]CAG8175347.1 unnamed protein product [Penicillium salamii]CAG8224610.1 unnamed protein product [Penicillium salamii]
MDYTAFCEFAMMPSVVPSADKTNMTIDAPFDPYVVAPNAMRRILGQFAHILRQIMQPAQQLEGVNMASPDDLIQLQRWNSQISSAESRSLNELVLTRCRDQPRTTAVCAWDGSLTYSDLAGLSSSLAYRLRLLGAHPGSSVGICLERSIWSVVAILAILRAGGTCILLDLHHPRQRINDILKETSVQVVINSQATAALTSGLTSTEVCLDQSIRDSLLQTPTGRPKGIVIPHSTLASSIRYHSAPMNVRAGSRVLHFSSYVFDVSIYEIFTTLAAGATLCIPLEFDRTNALSGTMCRLQANWAFLTPSAAQTLRPWEVPCLSTLVFGGEAVTREDVECWSAGRTLINGFGPTEATICGFGHIPPTGWTQGLIGTIVGGIGWVTMPTDKSRLAAIGAIGELLQEGPFLAAGYFNLPDVSAASFIDPPTWRQRMPLDSSSGLYRTGDLVQYQDDGTIRYMSRQGTRMKLHGQLIDLGEVESNTLREFPAANGVAAEIICLESGGNLATLVAYVRSDFHGPKDHDANFVLDSVSQEFRQSTTAAQKCLRKLLPSCMIPSIFIPVHVMPLTVTGKLDRRSLRPAIQSLSFEELQNYRAVSLAKSEVSSDSELLLQAMWAGLLAMAKESIGAEDSFLVSDGNSILVMQMAVMARRAGFEFTVADALSPNSSISSFALSLQVVRSGQGGLNLPAPSRPSVLTSVKFQQHLDSLRCQGTLSQEGSVTSARLATEAQSKLVLCYPWFNFRFPFEGELDEDRLRDACHTLVRAHSVLRVAFTEYREEIFQLTLAEDMELHLQVLATQCQLEPFCESFCHSEQAVPVPSAGIATRFTLVSKPSHTDQRLIIRLAHAQYDATSISILMRALESLYNDEKMIADASFDWYLDQRSCIASSPLDLTSATQLITGTYDLSLPAGLSSAVTLPTVVKAAASLVLARRFNWPDIVVGQTVDGRSLPFPNIDRIVGACINYIPFRIQTRASMTARDYLPNAQNQHARSLRSESVDLRTVVSPCTDWVSPTEFRYILQHQMANNGLDLTLGSKSASLKLVGGLSPGSEVWICSTETPFGVRIDIHCSGQKMGFESRPGHIYGK